MQITKDGVTMNLPPAWENISNPTLDQMIERGWIVAPEPELQPEEPYIPQSLPRWKGLAILELRGLTALVKSIVAAKNAIDGIAQIKFDNALTFDRTDELLVYVAQAAEMTTAQIDQLFIDGDALK